MTVVCVPMVGVRVVYVSFDRAQKTTAVSRKAVDGRVPAHSRCHQLSASEVRARGCRSSWIWNHGFQPFSGVTVVRRDGTMLYANEITPE